MLDCESKKKIGARFEEIKVDVTLLYETFFSLLAQLTAFFSWCFAGNGQQRVIIVIFAHISAQLLL